MIVKLLQKKKYFDSEAAVYLAYGPVRSFGGKVDIKKFCRIVL